MKKWHVHADEHKDDNKAGEETGYEPLLGTIYMRKLVFYFSALEMTLDAKASNSLGMMFA